MIAWIDLIFSIRAFQHSINFIEEENSVLWWCASRARCAGHLVCASQLGQPGAPGAHIQ